MKHYYVTLKHDNGKKTITVGAENEDQARQRACDSENAPLCAVAKIEQCYIYVSMTDRYMSDWGQADGKISKLVLVCEDRNEADFVVNKAENRPEMKYINMSFGKMPYYNFNKYKVNILNRETAENYWYPKND